MKENYNYGECQIETEKKYNRVNRLVEIERNLTNKPSTKNIAEYYDFLNEIIINLENNPFQPENLLILPDCQIDGGAVKEALIRNPHFIDEALTMVKFYRDFMIDHNCSPISYIQGQDEKKNGKINLDTFDTEFYQSTDGRFLPIFYTNNFLPKFFSEMDNHQLREDYLKTREKLSAQIVTLDAEIMNIGSYFESWQNFKNQYPDELNKLITLCKENEESEWKLFKMFEERKKLTFEDHINCKVAVLKRDIIPMKAYTILRTMGIDAFTLRA